MVAGGGGGGGGGRGVTKLSQNLQFIISTPVYYTDMEGASITT